MRSVSGWLLAVDFAYLLIQLFLDFVVFVLLFLISHCINRYFVCHTGGVASARSFHTSDIRVGEGFVCLVLSKQTLHILAKKVSEQAIVVSFFYILF